MREGHVLGEGVGLHRLPRPAMLTACDAWNPVGAPPVLGEGERPRAGPLKPVVRLHGSPRDPARGTDRGADQRPQIRAPPIPRFRRTRRREICAGWPAAPVDKRSGAASGQANTVEKDVDLLHERVAQAYALLFVPASRRADVRLGLPPDNQSVGHRSRRMSSRAVSQASTSVGVLFMLPDSLVQQAAFGVAQRSLLELSGDLVPELLDETNSFVHRKSSEGVNDLLSVHLHGPSACDSTAGRR